MKKTFLFMLLLAAFSWAASPVGPLNDSRDGKTYNTVQIGNQVWMTENLNFRTESSWCYNDESENCQMYGRLYSWHAAMKACPAGWRLPTSADFDTLQAFAEKNVDSEDAVASALKAKYGWENNDGEVMRNADTFGFAALPGGSHGSKLCKVERCTNFWTSSIDASFPEKIAVTYGFTGGDQYFIKGTNSKSLGYSVRCIKDSW